MTAPTVCPRTGRHTWPGVVQYRIAEGPQAGTVMDYPPDRHVFPAPLVADPATGRTCRRPGSAAYEIIIHDLPAFERLGWSGALYGPGHCGPRGEAVDN